MKSPGLEEQEEADVYGNFPSRNDSSTGEVTRRKTNTFRSKHSETEQRRRIKINERFQTLMDLIPQSDQKRDKASFLLEVIEYIRFLQEKLQIYEGCHQICSQGPTKLIPWKNNQRSAEDDVNDSSQIIKSWPNYEKGAAPPGTLSDMQNSLDSDVNSAVVFKALDQIPATAVPSYLPAEPLLHSIQQDSWQVRSGSGSTVNNINELPDLKDETSVSSSIVYSQGVLNALTETLTSSGVNLSETMISVQLNVRKSADPEFTVAASASVENDKIPDEKVGSQTKSRNFYEESGPVQKRIKR